MPCASFYKEMARISEGLQKGRRDPGLPDPVKLTASLLKDKEVDPYNLSLRRLWEATVPDGREALYAMQPTGSGGFKLMEATLGAVDSGVFSKITGQFLYDRVLAGYQRVESVWRKLVREEQTRFIRGEKEPRVGGIGDEFAGNIDEGQPFSSVSLSEEWVEYPAAQKFGKDIFLTEELLVEDRSGDILAAASKIGEWMDVQKDVRVMTTVTGATGGNTYKYKDDAAISVYQSSTPYINIQASNALLDYTDVEAAGLLFDAMTDPATGEYIAVPTPDLLVPTALKTTAWRVKTATTVTAVDNTAAMNTLRTQAGNPLGPVWPIGDIISSPRVKGVTSSATTWYCGDFKRAFVWKFWKKLTTEQYPANSFSMVKRGIVAGWYTVEAGVCGVSEPRYVVKCTA